MARRRHQDPAELLHALLDRHEGNPDPARGQTEFAAATFADSAARERFNAVLADAERRGAIHIRHGRRELRHLVERVTLADPGVLYGLLGREPRAATVDRALSEIHRQLAGRSQHAGLRGELASLDDAWRAGSRHRGIAVAAVDEATSYLIALSAVLARSPDDLSDLRTYSSQVTGDSKRIERHRRPLVAAAVDLGLVPVGVSVEAALSMLGLEKFAHPVLMGGGLTLAGTAFPEGSFLGILPRDLPRIAVPARADVLLTVENYASFNRYVAEVMGPREIVVYTGGWPAHGVVAVLRHLAPQAARMLHWGDIDLHGAAIADFIWRTVDRRLELHRMSPALADSMGAPGQPARLRGVDPESPAYPLFRYLAGGGGTLEQEELDPVSAV